MSFHAKLESTLASDWGRACAVIVVGLKSAVDKAIEEGAQEARDTHRYTDRTGDLTESIGDRLISLTAYGAEGVIEATMDYASYVENGTSRARAFPFMGQAYLKAERVLEREVDIAVAGAQAALP